MSIFLKNIALLAQFVILKMYYFRDYIISVGMDFSQSQTIL